jgi:hypothetical protein
VSGAALRGGEEQPERLRGDADDLGIEVQQEQPVALQPGLVADQRARCRSLEIPSAVADERTATGGSPSSR